MHHTPARRRPFATARRVTRFALACAMMLTPLSAAAQADDETVTSVGYDELLAKSTLYAVVPMHGVMGIDCPGDAVHQTLKAAADHPDIKHAVFMIDSGSGIPLEHEHVGVFDNELEVTAVVRNAVATAIFPVFFANNIYMVDSALVGNLPLSRYVDKGSEQVTAKQVGIYSSMLASAAQSRGHSDAIAYAMIDDKKDLYYWEQDGKKMLSNTAPNNPSAATNYTIYTSDFSGSVLTLDRPRAIKLGFAKPIDVFDHMVLGEYLDKPGWLPANQFGRVANEIGHLADELKPIRDFIREYDNQISTENLDPKDKSDAARGFREFKRNLDDAVDNLDIIDSALKALYDVHPERHVYFSQPGGKTVLKDPAKWAADAAQAKREANRAYTTLRRLTASFQSCGFDEEYLYEINLQMKDILDHLQGINRHGNAAYWQDHAKEDLPDDVYG